MHIGETYLRRYRGFECRDHRMNMGSERNMDLDPFTVWYDVGYSKTINAMSSCIIIAKRIQFNVHHLFRSQKFHFSHNSESINSWPRVRILIFRDTSCSKTCTQTIHSFLHSKYPEICIFQNVLNDQIEQLVPWKMNIMNAYRRDIPSEIRVMAVRVQCVPGIESYVHSMCNLQKPMCWLGLLDDEMKKVMLRKKQMAQLLPKQAHYDAVIGIEMHCAESNLIALVWITFLWFWV